MSEPSRRDLLSAGGAVGLLGAERAAGTPTRRGDILAAQPGGAWRSFQRNTRNTGATDAPGPATDASVRWAAETGKSVRGPVSVVDRTVYAGSMDGSLYALDAGDGARRWRYEATEGVSTAPAVVAGRAFVVDWDAVVHAVDADSGAGEWTRDLGGTMHTEQPSPTVADGWVYAGTAHGQVSALEAATGEPRWSVEVGEAVGTTPAVAAGLVLVATDDGTVRALDAEDGEVRWRFDADAGVEAAPTVADKTAMIADRDGTLSAVALGNGERRWSRNVGRELYSSPAVATPEGVDGRTVYVGGLEGTAAALDAATGEPRWSRSIGTEALAPSVGARTVYFGQGGIGNVAVALDAATGERRWSVTRETEFSSAPSPAVVGTDVYLGGNGSSVRALTGPAGPERTATGGGTTAESPGTTPDPGREERVTPAPLAAWVEGWYPLLAWLAGVSLLGPVVLGGLVAVANRLDGPDDDDAD